MSSHAAREPALLPQHREHLRAGGLADFTIDEAGLFSINGDGPTFGLPAGLSGIAFPYFGTEVRISGRRMPLHRMRVDEACRRKPDQKYESPAKARIEEGLPYHIYVPPRIEELRKRTEAPICITEGEKKALVLNQHGYPCLGLPGVYMFGDPLDEAPHVERRLHPDLRRWHWRDRVVYVCFDADRLDNEQVALAHERLCARLAAEGARVRVVTVPDGPGIDDHIVRHGAAVVESLIDEAAPWTPEVWRIQRISPSAPASVAWAQLGAIGPITRRLDTTTLEVVVEFAAKRLPTLDARRVARTLGLRGRSDLPEIVVNGRQQREVISDAWGALLAGEYGENLFHYSGRAVRLTRATPGEAALEPVSADKLNALLRRSASWLRDTPDGRVDVAVPKDIAPDMLALPNEDLPVLDRLVRTPALGRDKTMWRQEGYVAAHRTFIDLPSYLADLPLMPLADSLALLREELLLDFQFVAEADRTHAVAALLLPFVRPAIDGPTPLHLVEAPTEGTGKGLLTDVIARIATGRAAQPTTLPRTDDAIRKKLTAILRDAPTMVVLDNLAGVVDSATLAAVLTATVYTDRLLGVSEMLTLNNNALWIATGNNPQLSREIARRTIRIRLDASSSTPWRGRSFKHPDLARWTDRHRRELVAAVLGLVQAWVDAGQPDAGAHLGSFEDWARIVGGILAHAGFEGFLAHDEVASELIDPEEVDWGALVVFWAARPGSTTDRVNAGYLLNLARENQLLIGASESSEHATRARFGKGLSQRRHRVYEGWRICHKHDKARKQAVYWLERVG